MTKYFRAERLDGRDAHVMFVPESLHVRCSLNEIMEMDHVIQVLPDGSISDDEMDIYAPNAYGSQDGPEFSADEWSAIGSSSQQGGGHIMHNSEFIGRGLWELMREQPGFYVAVPVHWSDFWADEDDEEGWTTEGWVLAFCEATPRHLANPGHPEGYLPDCPGCEAKCHCTQGHAECVFSGEHNGLAEV